MVRGGQGMVPGPQGDSDEKGNNLANGKWGSWEVFLGEWLKLRQGKNTQAGDLGKDKLEGLQKVLFSCKKCEVVLLFCSVPLKGDVSQSNFVRQRK